MNAPSDKSITIIGAGLAGCLLAILLTRQGWRIELYERRGDPRIKGYEGGRSINLALAERGRHALEQAGALDEVMRHAVMMRGRMVHPQAGTPQLLRYGRNDSEVIWSIHRADLNLTLLRLAEEAGARIHFHRRLHTVDFKARYARFIDDRDDQPHDIRFDSLIGADGAGSALRSEMIRWGGFEETTEFLDHSYKELEIPPGPDGGFLIEPNALHIWPRGRYMCIALPNDEGTFTVTLFLPNEATPGHPDEPSFATVRSGADAEALFGEQFPDALPLIPDLEADWERHPPGLLGTLKLDRWQLDDRAVLIGDAAHAMVPFHGQGMNCAFEDCIALAAHVASCSDLSRAFTAYASERKPNAAAIQRMALDNYIEMRDLVDDPAFLLQRELERVLQTRHPERFVPHYTMVTFMRIPYATALLRTDIQRRILEEATRGLESLAGLDWHAVDLAVLTRLTPLAATR